MEERLPAELLELVRKAGEVAASQGQRLYLVGGAVRDLLLGQPSLDLDLVVEGHAPELARHLARAWGGEVLAHPHFGTAKFRRGELSIDLVTARSETYSRPGALPNVKPGSIDDDLLRRDFTINAMAIHLDPASYGELVDPYHGRGDLDQRLIRILHPKSFVDDATRILRALRYEQRLDFQLEATTAELLRQDTPMLDSITGDRIRHELELILREAYPEKALVQAQELGVLARIHPSLRGDSWLAERFGEARELTPGTPPEPSLYLCLLIHRLSKEGNELLIRRLRMAKATARTMRDTLTLKSELPALAEPCLPPSSIYRLLERYSPAALLANALASDSPLVRQRLHLFLDELRYVKLSLNGEDLKRLGAPPGPRLGRMLQALHEAKLDGEAKTRQEEEELVGRWLRLVEDDS